MDAVEFSNQAADHFAEKPGKIFIPNAHNGLNTGENNISYRYASIDAAFPAVNPGHRPLGNLILVQIRQPELRTGGGIILDSELRKAEQNNTQVAKVISVGPLAFKSRDTAQPWPEGAWAEVGSFVRIPKYQGDRFTVAFNREDYDIDLVTGKRKPTQVQDNAEFCFIKDLALVAIVDDPLTGRAFL